MKEIIYIYPIIKIDQVYFHFLIQKFLISQLTIRDFFCCYLQTVTEI